MHIFPSCKWLELEHLKLLHGMFLCVSAISAEASFKPGTGHQLAQCRRRPASFLNQAFLITKSFEFSNIHLSTSSQWLVSPRKQSHCCLPCPLGNMSKTAQATRNTITLKGSTKVVTEFFAYAVNRWVLNVMIFNAKTTISLTSLEQSRRPLSVIVPLWQIITSGRAFMGFIYLCRILYALKHSILQDVLDGFKTLQLPSGQANKDSIPSKFHTCQTPF